MSEPEWTSLVLNERMEVDQEFHEKVAASNFSSQQWDVIMTAVEFEIEQPGDPEQARLVADTSMVEAVLPEVEQIEDASFMAGVGDPGGRETGGSDGLFGNVRRALGLDDGDKTRERLAAAEELAQMYADDLQEKLESRDRWEEVRRAASAGTATDR